MKNFIVGSLIIGVAIVIGFVMSSKGNLGASSGPEHLQREYFFGGLVQGGGKLNSAIATSTTYTAKEICENSLVKITSTATAGATTTLPTAATLINTCLPKDGDFKDVVFWNANVSAASTTSISPGTGMIMALEEVTGANKLMAGGNLVSIRFIRASSTGVYALLGEFDPE